MMKYIQHWIRLFLPILMVVLVACSSTPTKNNLSTKQSSRVALESKHIETAQSNVSPVLKKDYDQALEYMKQGSYIKAEPLLIRVAEKQQNLSGPYINLGIIQLSLGAYDEAEKWLLQAESRNPKNPEIQNYLGVIFRNQGRFRDAEQAYTKAIALNPKLAKAYMNLAVLYDLYLPNYQSALKNYKRYKELTPEDKKVESWIAEIEQRIQASN